MFESAVLTIGPGRRARSAAVLPLAALAHVVVIAAVIAAQLLAVEDLRPATEAITPVFLPPPPPPVEGPTPREHAATTSARPRSVVQPGDVPDAVPTPPDHAEPAAGSGVPSGVGDPAATGGDGGPAVETATASPPDAVGPPEPPAILAVGGEVLAPEIVTRVMPAYPPAARQAGRQGPVRVRAVIAADGTVRSVEVVEDRPRFGCGEAAATAIRSWRFRPATLRGRPVAVVMEITVAFTLSRG